MDLTIPSGSSLLQILFYACSLYSFYYIYWELTTGASRRRLSKDNCCGVIRKWVTKDPLLGLDFLANTLRALHNHTGLESNRRYYAALGINTFQVNMLRQNFIFTIEPENIKTVLSLDFKLWSIGVDRKKFLKPFLGDGILTTDGEAWQHSRKMLRPFFARSQIVDLQMFEKHVDHLIQAIPRDSSTIDLQIHFFRSTFDIAIQFLFGESNIIPDVQSESYLKFVQAVNYCQYPFPESGRFSFVKFFLPDLRYKRECKVVHEFTDALIEKALTIEPLVDSNQCTSRHAFLHELLSQTSDKVKIRSELLNLFVAARDTTASLLSNVWFELSKRPDIWARLREEVDTLEGSPPSYDQLKEKKYLRAVLNESLRLYPIIPSNSRQALSDTVLPLGGGKDGLSPILVRKGEVVTWDVHAMHRRKDFYGKDAECFRPERWLDTDDQNGLRVGWEFLPFNGGPRICIGQQFALMEVSYFTVRLMQAFSGLESRDPLPWREKFTLSCTGLGGCKVALTPATAQRRS